MKVWINQDPVRLERYRMAENLLFAVLAETPERELSPCEKLFVALSSNVPCHAGYLTDVYMSCGCFEKAKEAYVQSDHQRKLGDICWIQGDLDGANFHYINPISKAQSYRDHPDYDRLIKLSFVREDWNGVVEWFLKTPFSSGFGEGRVICANSETAAGPFLEMLAIALEAMDQKTSDDIQSVLASAFRMSSRVWSRYRSLPKYSDVKTIQKIKKRCLPRPGKRPQISVDEALKRGRTKRAEEILEYINSCDVLLDEAQDYLEKYGKTGQEDILNDFIEVVTHSGLSAVSHSFLFSAMGHDSFDSNDIPPERIARLYSAHPVMNKRHFGKLLNVKFENRIPITGKDLITGLFQQMGSLSADLDPESVALPFSFRNLSNFREWAELRLDDWISARGSVSVSLVSETWRNKTAKKVRPVFGGNRMEYPSTPRDMSEWMELLNEAAVWLKSRWKREIGVTEWVSENQLFQLLKRRLKGLEVQQHAQPEWISPQHFDVYIPSRMIAVEYMGRQHFEPVEFFGGERGFAILQDRDMRKRQICNERGVELIYFRYNDDITVRANEIISYIKDKCALE